MTSDDSQPSPTLEELQRAETVLHACGLRFDGYRYAESRTSQDASGWLVDQRTTFARSLSLPDVPEDALATLFCFQRGARDYGWFLDRSPESLAGPLLFLQLYREPVPGQWRYEPYAADWDRLPSAELELAASIVRRWLLWGTGTLFVA